MNHHQQDEQEITPWNEAQQFLIDNKIFVHESVGEFGFLSHLLNAFHHQETLRALKEGQKELPGDGDIADMTMVNNESNYSDKEDVIFFEGAKRMRDKAAGIIAEKDEQFLHHDTVLRAIISEKDNLIKEREETILELQEHLQRYAPSK